MDEPFGLGQLAPMVK